MSLNMHGTAAIFFFTKCGSLVGCVVKFQNAT